MHGSVELQHYADSVLSSVKLTFLYNNSEFQVSHY